MVGLLSVAGDLRGKEMFVACNDLHLLLKPCSHEFAEKRKKHTCAACAANAPFRSALS